MARKAKLSWLAQTIVDNYQQLIAGLEPFIGPDVKRVYLSHAMYQRMVRERQSVSPVGLNEFIDAMGEAIEYLDVG